MNLTVRQTSDISTCLALRRVVFIDEQGVSEAEEVDGFDSEALHFVAKQDGTPVGCARVLLKDEIGKIGRVCVLKEARGNGVGGELIKTCVTTLREQTNVKKAVLGSQCHAIRFYERLGFSVFGPIYVDAGIDHRDMELVL